MRISIFDNQYSAIQELPEERRGAFWMALMAYVFEDIEPEFDEPLERIVWQFALPYLDKSKTNSANGKKGGRKPGGKSGENMRNETETKANENRNKSETKANGNRALYVTESERDGLGVSLKDTLTPSHAQGAAGGTRPTTPSADENAAIFEEVDKRYQDPKGYEPKNMAAYLEDFSAAVQEEHPEAVPCPRNLKAVGA